MNAKTDNERQRIFFNWQTQLLTQEYPMNTISNLKSVIASKYVITTCILFP